MKIKFPDFLTALILVLFVFMLWQMKQQDWGTFFLLLAAEVGLIAIRSTGRATSARL